MFRTRLVRGRAPGRSLLLIAVALGSSACTIRRYVAEDYPQYLAKNEGKATLPSTQRASEYLLTPATQAYSYEFRSGLSGYANLWIVEIGKMLDETLMSADVQAAFGGLQKVSEPKPDASTKGLLTFDLSGYEFKDFGAHVSLAVSLTSGGAVVFSKTYDEKGATQGGKVFWGGAWAQKNAIQQSTKLALDEILHQLVDDLNAATP